MEEEIWKDIEEYEGLYQVSSLGRIRSLDRIVWKSYLKKSIIKKQKLRNDGYYQILLSKGGTYRTFRSHRIVAKAFVPNPENKPQINHKNGIKADNRVENLEWCTSFENMAHAFDSGLNWHRGERATGAILTKNQALEIKYNKPNISTTKLGEMYGVSKSAVMDILSGKTWKHI